MLTNPQWVTYWSKAQRGLQLVSEDIVNRTIRFQIKHMPCTACIRIRFANHYGEQAVRISNVHVYAPSGHQTATFVNASQMKIEPKQSCISDDIHIHLKHHDTLTIAYTIPAHHEQDLPASAFGSEGTAISLEPQTLAITSHMETVPSAVKKRLQASYYEKLVYVLSGIDILTNEFHHTIVAFGDSITEQGFWLDAIRPALEEQGYTVVNQGISGNRLLRDMQYLKLTPSLPALTKLPLTNQIFGSAAIDRFVRDVYDAHVNVSHVILAIGINDIYQPDSACALANELPTLQALIKGYQRLIEQAKAYGSKVLACTITPFTGATNITTEKEELRLCLNDWILHHPSIDYAIDVSKEVSTEDYCLLPQYDSGDHLHPNQAGGKAMANAFACFLKELGD